MNTNERGLVTAHSVEHIVQTYRDAEVRIREALAVIAEHQNRIRDVFGEGSHISLSTRDLNFDTPERQMADMERQAWRRIVDLAGIRRMMSVKAADDLNKMLEQQKLPDLTVENVHNMLATARTNAPDHIAEAVREVHGFLRPRSNEYKTNSQFDIGRKVILSYWVSPGYGRPFRAQYHRDAEFRALDNVFALLDGKPGVTTHAGTLADAIALSKDGTGETPYFRFRACKNGNLHLEFKRMDLVEKLNAIAGGKNLYAPKEAA